MRRAIKSKSQGVRSKISRHISIAPPVLGWNDRDALASMKQEYAVALENLFPASTYCEVRGGFSSYVTGLTNTGKTLVVYTGINGTDYLFATTSSGVYNVSTEGAVGASVAARTNGKHQTTMFGDGTNNYLIMCNGVDKPLYYNGTTWVAVDGVSSPALTGITTTNLIAPFLFKGRLSFIQKDSLSFWYLAAGVAGGALTEYPLDGVAKRGGYLMAAASWTMDAGSGPEDRLVFVTSEGEALVYAGTNPASASDFGLVGVYDIGQPIGRRCLAKFGGDLVVITKRGAFPLSAALQSASVDNRFSLTNIIDSAFTLAAESYSSVFGWECVVYDKEGALILNIPNSEGGRHEQFVMNTVTKAWCKFKGWDAECFCVFNDALYFCKDTSVYKAWDGASDNGANINVYGKPAFTKLGSDTQKRVTLFRATFLCNGRLNYLTHIDVDFDDKSLYGATSSYSISSDKWTPGGTAQWGVARWSGGLRPLKDWSAPKQSFGTYLSGKIKLSNNSLSIRWLMNEYIVEDGFAI